LYEGAIASFLNSALGFKPYAVLWVAEIERGGDYFRR